MTLDEARNAVLLATARDKCTMYISARIVRGPGWPGSFGIDPNGYGITDWFDGSVVECWHDGKHRETTVF